MLEGDVDDEWKAILRDLELTESISVGRFVLCSVREQIVSIQIHAFSDSSFNAYCGVIYFRIKTVYRIIVKFLTAKTKVAPLKKPTIPRLELLGCHLLAKLFGSVQEALNGG